LGKNGIPIGIHQINDHPQYVLGNVGQTMAILTTHLGMVTIPPTKKWCFSWGPGDGANDIVLPCFTHSMTVMTPKKYQKIIHQQQTAAQSATAHAPGLGGRSRPTATCSELAEGKIDVMIPYCWNPMANRDEICVPVWK